VLGPSLPNNSFVTDCCRNRGSKQYINPQGWPMTSPSSSAALGAPTKGFFPSPENVGCPTIAGAEIRWCTCAMNFPNMASRAAPPQALPPKQQPATRGDIDAAIEQLEAIVRVLEEIRDQRKV
jgi:hypothetical protein